MQEFEHIKAAKRGNSRSQKWLFDQHAAPMMKLCTRYLKDEFQAEEAFIQAFQKALTKLDMYEERPDTGFNHWLSRIMINECLMILRKEQRFEKVQEDQFIDTEQTERMSEAEYIYQFILELPMGYRTVFNLFAIEGYSHKEIAEMLNINEGTSRSQLNKARQILQKKIEQLNQRNGTY